MIILVSITYDFTCYPEPIFLIAKRPFILALMKLVTTKVNRTVYVNICVLQCKRLHLFSITYNK